MLGVVAMTVLVLPRLLVLIPELTGQPAPPVPLWVLVLASLVQSGVLLGLAVWCGCALGAHVGLHAPLFEGSSKARGHDCSPAPSAASSVARCWSPS